MSKWKNIWQNDACKTCKGYRLSKKSLAVKVDGRHIGEVTELSIEKALAFFNNVTLSEKETQIAKLILREIDRTSSISYKCWA